MCVRVDTGASQESHNPPEWLICALWNIVEYQAYFMIQPSASTLFFSQRLGLFVKLSRSWPSGPPPSPLSRTFKHFRHVADAFIHGAACRSGQFGWGTNLRLMIDTVFYRLLCGETCMYMCEPLSCGLDKQAHHMRWCVLTAGANKGTAELDARGKDWLPPTHLDKLAVVFTSLFSPSSRTFFPPLSV